MKPLTPACQQLQRELWGLQQVLNNVGAYIFTKDLAGCYTYANQLVCELFGLPLAEVLGKDDSHFFDLAVSDQLRVNDRRVMEQGETLAREEHNVVRSSGDSRIYWTVKAPVRDEHGQIVGMCGISTDITERKQLEETLREQSHLLDTVLNNVDSNIYMKTIERRYLYANEQAASRLGSTSADIVGKLDSDLLGPQVAERLWAIDRQVFETGQKVAGEEEIIHDDGRHACYWSVKVPISLKDQPRALIGFSTDITELQLLRKQLEQQALTDMLTGISNRRHFMQRLEQAFSLARRHHQPLSLIMLDIDFFKHINDRYGHLSGDKVLVALAQHLQGLMRESDVVGRIGGEEFAILLPQTDGEAALAVAERLRSSVADMVVSGDDDRSISLTASFGVAALPPEAVDGLILLKLADQALYYCKDNGRNRGHLQPHAAGEALPVLPDNS